MFSLENHNVVATRTGPRFQAGGLYMPGYAKMDTSGLGGLGFIKGVDPLKAVNRMMHGWAPEPLRRAVQIGVRSAFVLTPPAWIFTDVRKQAFKDVEMLAKRTPQMAVGAATGFVVSGFNPFGAVAGAAIAGSKKGSGFKFKVYKAGVEPGLMGGGAVSTGYALTGAKILGPSATYTQMVQGVTGGYGGVSSAKTTVTAAQQTARGNELVAAYEVASGGQAATPAIKAQLFQQAAAEAAKANATSWLSSAKSFAWEFGKEQVKDFAINYAKSELDPAKLPNPFGGSGAIEPIEGLELGPTLQQEIVALPDELRTTLLQKKVAEDLTSNPLYQTMPEGGMYPAVTPQWLMVDPITLMDEATAARVKERVPKPPDLPIRKISPPPQGMAGIGDDENEWENTFDDSYLDPFDVGAGSYSYRSGPLMMPNHRNRRMRRGYVFG